MKKQAQISGWKVLTDLKLTSVANCCGLCMLSSARRMWQLSSKAFYTAICLSKLVVHLWYFCLRQLMVYSATALTLGFFIMVLSMRASKLTSHRQTSSSCSKISISWDEMMVLISSVSLGTKLLKYFKASFVVSINQVSSHPASLAVYLKKSTIYLVKYFLISRSSMRQFLLQIARSRGSLSILRLRNSFLNFMGQVRMQSLKALLSSLSLFLSLRVFSSRGILGCRFSSLSLSSICRSRVSVNCLTSSDSTWNTFSTTRNSSKSSICSRPPAMLPKLNPISFMGRPACASLMNRQDSTTNAADSCSYLLECSYSWTKVSMKGRYLGWLEQIMSRQAFWVRLPLLQMLLRLIEERSSGLLVSWSKKPSFFRLNEISSALVLVFMVCFIYYIFNQQYCLYSSLPVTSWPQGLLPSRYQ